MKRVFSVTMITLFTVLAAMGSVPAGLETDIAENMATVPTDSTTMAAQLRKN